MHGSVRTWFDKKDARKGGGIRCMMRVMHRSLAEKLYRLHSLNVGDVKSQLANRSQTAVFERTLDIL